MQPFRLGFSLITHPLKVLLYSIGSQVRQVLERVSLEETFGRKLSTNTQKKRLSINFSKTVRHSPKTTNSPCRSHLAGSCLNPDSPPSTPFPVLITHPLNPRPHHSPLILSILVLRIRLTTIKRPTQLSLLGLSDSDVGVCLTSSERRGVSSLDSGHAASDSAAKLLV